MAVVIADLLPEAVLVEVGKGSIEVRGIPLDQLVPLIARHGEGLSKFLVGDKFNAEAMALHAPEIVVDLLAAACDAKGQEADLRRLPAAVQIEILLTTWKLSVPDVKKLRSSLLGLIKSLNLSDAQKAKLIPLNGPSETLSPSPLSDSSPTDIDSETSEATP